METFYLVIVLAPLFGSLVAGLFGSLVGRRGAHWVTNIGVGISTVLSMLAYKHHVIDGSADFNQAIYTWLSSGGIDFQIGFLIDKLSVTMMVVVSFVSWMIHIYTIGYMRNDPGYQRFFSYISLFTFAMLMLVMSNNFFQLFFGWEAVGLVSYLLIGFWYKKESAIFANLKAFLVNRIGDFGFLLGIAAVLMYFNTLDYMDVFNNVEQHANTTITIINGESWSLMSVICISLFIGAMGKSAQVPLHVWLPDSMEGPTPISALIHAATMVTAGIFMVSRMSPLFELSTTALNFILIIGSVTALSMGLLAVVQNDIKRVIAYSTLSQLGYMTVALGASAYAAAMFHLVTHAFFKALLFLAAGSVIIVMHHEQDMRKMGGLFKYMPITCLTCLIGSLALVGFPGTSGFFSKDIIIEAVHHSSLPASNFAYYAVLIGVFITALYSFRLFFMTFFGKENMSREVWEKLHEAPAVITTPLLILAVPSLLLGFFLVDPLLVGNYFADAIYVSSEHDVLSIIGAEYEGILPFMFHAFLYPPVYFTFLGIFFAWLCYVKFPHFPSQLAGNIGFIYRLLVNKYWFDEFNQIIFANGARKFGYFLFQYGDSKLIDGVFVNGSAKAIRTFSAAIRNIQSGYLYHYAFAIIIGLLTLIAIFVHRILF
ncbi:MAG: NADH-quinone oxidoreductase subunit L [Legionellales bacterium]|nr:NADH-quinone oxidoreductase subunit L [Legionellales bacterium]